MLTARPTIYNGIEMRSRLEAAAARDLSAKGINWVYEPQCFASEAGQYLPDFQVFFRDGQLCPTYLEIKPDFILQADRELALRQAKAICSGMEIIAGSIDTVGLWVHFCAGNPFFISATLVTVYVDGRHAGWKWTDRTSKFDLCKSLF